MALQSFDDFWAAHYMVLGIVFAISVVFGAVANKTNFCTMGAVSDWVNMGDTGRLRAWLFAISVAMLGVILMENYGIASVESTQPPYRDGTLMWSRFIIGGIMFGIGMTLGSGCVNKTLIRIGGGNLKSVVVFIFIAVFAYLMTNTIPFMDTDESLFSLIFYQWMNDSSVSLSAGKQDLGSILAHNVTGTETNAGRVILGLIIAALLLAFIFKSKDFYTRYDNVLGGLVVGLCVIGGWYMTSSFAIINKDGETFTWVSYAVEQTWSFLEDSTANRPVSVATQSYSFTNFSGQTLKYITSLFDFRLLNFGVISVFGVIFGSLIWALVSRNFRLEWFANRKDFLTHVIGGVLMGVGGVLALGCTIGQGVTGVSTLAFGSFLALGSIIIGSAMTMKIQYYKLVYENEASFFKALITSLVDLRLLPSSWRRLEAV